MSSGAHAIWYIQEPSLEERFRGVVAVNGSTTDTWNSLSSMACTVIASWNRGDVSAALKTVASVMVMLMNGVHIRSLCSFCSHDLSDIYSARSSY